MTIEQQIAELTRRIAAIESITMPHGRSKMHEDLIDQLEKDPVGCKEIADKIQSEWAEKIEPEKDYVILTSTRKYTNNILVSEEILSVLRKSDNKEFMVRQKTSQGEVVSFKEHVTNILLVELLEDGAEPYWRNLNNIQPLPERKPLFRSEDGKDIFEEQDYWPVSKKTFKISGPFQISKNGRLYIDEDNIRFSTLAAAEEFVVNNMAAFTAKEMKQCNMIPSLWYEEKINNHARKRCGLDKEEEKA